MENEQLPQAGCDRQDIVTAALLVIGDEILSGRTKDQNIGYIADYMTAIGIRLSEVRVVSDIEEDIVAAINALRAVYDYVFTTGGIGPTHDDITADAVARAFGVAIDIDERAVAIMRERYSEETLTPTRLRMARIPQGAELIQNSVSSAPGFMIENVIVMAGVPRIMQVMLDDVAPRLKTGRKLLTRTIRVERPEGDVAPGLGRVQDEYRDVQMGSYPFFSKEKLGTNLVLRSSDEEKLDEAFKSIWQMLDEEGFTEYASEVNPSETAD
jgi:molybdenum cofactor synthesis domain-containing protein